MAKTLATHVSVTDEEGAAHSFGPGDKVPSWASALITNPKAWASDEGEPESEEETSEEAADDVPIPAKGGPKATAAAWAEYAKSKGFAIEGEPSRNEIIEALANEGIPTE